MNLRFILAAALSAATSAVLAQATGVPLMNPPLGSASAPAAAAKPATPPAPVVNGFATINWDALVPADWDPFKDFKGTNLAALNDGDPRAQQLLKQMREIWDNAPTNAQLVGQKVRIPGFVVPL